MFSTLLSLFISIAFAGVDPSNLVKQGDGTASDKHIIFNNGAAAKPEIKWNNGGGAIQFSHDGLTFSDIGSGGGANSFTYVGRNTIVDAGAGAYWQLSSAATPTDFPLFFGTVSQTQTNVAAGFTIGASVSDAPGLTLTGPAGTYLFIGTALWKTSSTPGGRAGFIFCDDSTCATDVNEIHIGGSQTAGNTMVFGKMTFGSPITTKHIRVKGTLTTSNLSFIEVGTALAKINIHVFKIQ